MSLFKLVVPAVKYLDSYVAALRYGWSPDNVRGKAAADEQLEAIESDPVTFLAWLDDPKAEGPPIHLPDGSAVKRLPSIQRWIWDGEFCGSIGFRWQHGTPQLPLNVLGHIGFTVVPWKRGKGHARRALSLILDEARMRRLPYVELTTAPDNIASQRVIRSQAGQLIERFQKPTAYGTNEALRFRISL